MSKDIRSFFTSSPRQKNSSFPTLDIGKKHTKKRAIVISDSDEDEDFVSPKRSKSSINNGKLNNCNSKKEKDATKKESKSKYFPVETIKVCDVFGSGPIKRDNSRKIIKKTIVKEEKEFHIDKDFESELLKLDNNVEILQHSLPDQHSNKETTHSQQKNSISPGPSSPKKEKKDSGKSSESNKVARKKQKMDSECTVVKREDSLKNVMPSSKVVEFQSSGQSGDLNSNSTNTSPSRKVSKQCAANNSAPVISDPSTENQIIIKKDSPPKNKLFGASPVKYKNTIKDKEVIMNVVVKNNDSISPEHKNHKNETSKAVLKGISKPSTTAESTKKSSDEVSEPALLPSNLWVEKYKPLTTKQIIGQQGDKSCVSKLQNWLQNWQKNQSSGKKLVKPSPWAKNDDGAFFKAALLSGPPGVGKTTTVHLVCKELGLDVVEFNASDTRSKKSLQQEVSELLSSSSLSKYCTGDPASEKRVSRQHVLVMDEVDGMAGNEDRGGVQQLIALVKGARVPVVCMCNDRNHPKIRSLANHCFDLRFSKPRAEQIRGAMMSVCFKEKIKITPDALTEIILSANQDIRLVLNHLSMLSAENMKIANGSKHIKLGPWDITRKIFSEEEHKTMSLNDKCDLFFHDYSVTPLFVQENYLHAVPHKPEAKNKIRKMELFAKAARSLSHGDLTERSIRSHNAWGLLPVQAIFSSYVPGEVLEGHLGAQISFPAWFGKNSRQNKMSRLVQELTVHSRLKISGNREAMNLDYLDPLEHHILSPLISQGAEGVPLALDALSEYTLVREDIESLSELCSWPNSISRFSRVDSKVKAAFTRAYNKANVVTPYAAAPIKKASRDADPELLMGEGYDGEGEAQEDDEGDDDGLQSDAMIVVKKKAVSKKSDKEDKPSSSKGNKNPKRGKKK